MSAPEAELGAEGSFQQKIEQHTTVMLLINI